MNIPRSLLVLAATLAGCVGPVKHAPPEIAHVAVKERMPLPTWATDALVKPMPANGTVGARLKDEDARGQTIDLANCHRKLLRLLDKGEQVDPKECSQK
jgi:hypothetical protein